MRIETSAIDALFIELSQFTQATTGKEIAQQIRINQLVGLIKRLEGGTEALLREFPGEYAD